MQLVEMNCPCCGGKLHVEAKAKKAICDYCDSEILLEGLNNSDSNPTVDSLIRRAFLLLEDEESEEAREYSNKALDIEPENGYAYLILLMADLDVSKEEDLNNEPEPFDENLNYKKIMRFGDEELKERISQYSKNVITKYNDNIYYHALALTGENTIAGYEEAIELFRKILSWKDSMQKISYCQQEIDRINNKATSFQNAFSIVFIVIVICIGLFSLLGGLFFL